MTPRPRRPLFVANGRGVGDERLKPMTISGTPKRHPPIESGLRLVIMQDVGPDDAGWIGGVGFVEPSNLASHRLYATGK